MRRGYILLMCCLCLFLRAAIADEVPQHVYKVAVDAEYAPYEFRDLDGEVKGMLPDMLREIGKDAGVTFKFFPMTWPDAVKALKDGQVDILNMIRTPERVSQYEFSNPHTRITQALFRHKNEVEIQNLKSLAGHVIALQKYDIAMEKMAGKNDINFITVSSKAQGFLALNAGKVAAFFAAEQPGLYFLKDHAMQNVDLAVEGLWPQDYCFAAKKGNTAIISLLNNGLTTLKSSGRYGQIIRAWRITPEIWFKKYSTQILSVAGILFVVALSLWLWVSLLRRTVKQRTDALSEEHARLQQSEEKFRALFENSPIGLALCQMDGKLIDVNPTYAAIMGRGVEETCTFSIQDITPRSYTKQEKLKLEKLETMGHYGPYEKEYIHKDGHLVPVRLHGLILERDGQRFIWSSVEDVSDDKHAESEMQRLFSIIEISADFIGMADANGDVIYVNSAGRDMVGLPTDVDIHTMDMSTFHSPAEMARMEKEVFPHAREMGSYRAEISFAHQDGTEIPTLATLSIQKNPDGTPASYSVIARDIRQEQEQQQRMEHTQRLESLGLLAGGIAHDFNNILTAILGNAALAERKAATQPQEIPRYLSNIVTSSEKAAGLCNQMLAYSGKGQFIITPLNLSVMVEEITKLLEISISKNVVLKYHLVDTIPAVEVDTAQIQQVIMNLVINASEAIDQKSGVICIGTGVMHADCGYLYDNCLNESIAEGRYVYLEVSDTGCGMDQQTQKRIFDPFFTTKSTGHGLGMSAVLGIVRGHHGTMKLYSEPGRGSTFKVLLPVSDQVMLDEQEHRSSEEKWQGSGTILVIDDEETIRETATMMLETMGFQTMTAENGEVGVESYRQHQEEIVAVLLDMTMPKLDGQGCFRELRRINKQVKVVLSSGYNEQEATSRFVGKGLAGFIQKPYHLDGLKDAMRMIFVGDQ